jgi:hypothetical protein
MRKEAQAEVTAKAKDAKAQSSVVRPSGPQAKAGPMLPAIFSFKTGTLPSPTAVSYSAADFDAQSIDPSQPFLVRDITALSEYCKKDQLASKLDFFARTFMGSQQQKGTGRGQMFLKDLGGLRDELFKFVPPSAICLDDLKSKITDGNLLRGLSAPSVFGFSADMLYVGTEWLQCANVRFHTSGCRRCAVIGFLDLQKFLIDDWDLALHPMATNMMPLSLNYNSNNNHNSNNNNNSNDNSKSNSLRRARAASQKSQWTALPRSALSCKLMMLPSSVISIVMSLL